MLDRKDIMQRLKDRRVDKVGAVTGLSRPTIISIRDGKNANPSYSTMKKLSDYFEDQESKKD